MTALKRNDDQYRALTRTFKLMTLAAASDSTTGVSDTTTINSTPPTYFCAKCADFHTEPDPDYWNHKPHATADKIVEKDRG